MSIVECADCGAMVPDEDPPRTPCARCGSQARKFGETAEERLTLRDSLSFRLKRPGAPLRKKRKGIIAEGSTGYERSQRAPLVKREFALDRLEDTYFERVTDAETGAVIHEDTGPLSSHVGHGSAKDK